MVVGHVLTCEPHPDSDHMHITVDGVEPGRDGNPAPLQIVCGAPNIAGRHQVVPVATVGAVLPGDVKIKKSKLRGVVSMGMCCSKRELGMGVTTRASGASRRRPHGMPFAEYVGSSDTVLDCEITPNRPDCLSMIGMARETGAIFDRDRDQPAIEEMAGKLAVSSEDPASVRITVEDDVRCPATPLASSAIEGRPLARLDGQAPRRHRPALHQQHRRRDELHLVPVRSAAARLRPGHLCRARWLRRMWWFAPPSRERLVTLDGEDRALTPDMTVIATPERGAWRLRALWAASTPR